MKIAAVRSDKIYKEMIPLSKYEKEDIYRYKLMKPFEFKWSCINVPLKSEKAGTYDVVSVSSINGWYSPNQIDSKLNSDIEKISSNKFWKSCNDSISKSLNKFEENGILLPVQNYTFTILLSDPKNPVSKMTGDYCGDGGIPGYIIGTIIPNERSLNMLPVALAHETNHNVRWQFMKWNSNITLADMIVSEGLAENFAALMFGEDKIGIWVRNTSQEMLEKVIKPIIKNNLYENNFNKLSCYLYGDDIMKLRGVKPLNVPYCAGYACGYNLIKYYLKKSGKSIYEATIMKTDEILKETEEFWN